MTIQHPRRTFPDREHLQLALEAGRMGTWSWNAILGEVEWDEAMHDRFGLDPGEFGRTFEDYLDLVHPEDRATTIAAITHAQETGVDLAFEHRVVWPDGSIHWLESRGRAVTGDDGTFLGMAGIGFDIDERKLLEEMRGEAVGLRADAELARQLEDAQRIARIGSWYWNRNTGEVWLSSEMQRQLDAPSARMLGADLQVLVEDRAHVDDLSLVRALLDRSTEQVDPFAFEHRMVVDGEIRYVVQRGEVLRDEAGEAIGLRGTSQDVTAFRRSEQALLSARERLERERQAVEVLHRVLIHPDFPPVPGLEIAARYLSAEVETDVGGDWYDAFPLPDGRVMLGVGDVSGHGLRAARLMAKLRHAIRAYATTDAEPGHVLALVDEYLAHFAEPEEFATVQLATFDHRTGEVVLVTGGHAPPVLLRPGGAEPVEVTPSRVLGVSLSELVVHPHRFVLEPGTALVFYTDGLVERRGEALRTFGDGTPRLMSLSLADTGMDAEAVCDMALDRCLGTISREDDVCVLVALRRDA